jgi:2'-5' RNA ligase/GNAT superfamily N-acetyltransferase
MVPGSAADEINGLRRALASTEVSRIAPHLTLVAPVNVRDEDVAAACELVRQAAFTVEPLVLELGPATSFLPLNPVFYLKVSGEQPVLDALSALASHLRSKPLAPPAARTEFPFVPHVTLNQHMVAERIRPALEALEGYRTTVVFEGVTLLEFSESKRRWHGLFEAPFSPRAIVGRGGIEIELSVSDRLDPAAAEWSRRAWQDYASQQYGPAVRPDEPFAIAGRIGGELAGVAEGEVRGPTCRLGRLMVGTPWRGSGVGTQLLRATEDHAVERGCRRIRLEALAESRAEGFYQGRGYQTVARLPGWREERDFVLMGRAL